MANGPEVRMTLNYIVDSSREKYGDLGAVGMAMEESITYEEFHDRICALAACLMERGLTKGDRVAILAENSYHWGIAYLAVVRMGGVGVPILPDLPEADVHHILGEMKVKAIFTTQRQIEKIYDLRADRPEIVMTLDDFQSAEGLPQTEQFSTIIETSLADYREKRVQDENFEFPEVDY